MRRIICLGNEFAGDDGVGIRVGRELARRPLPADVEVELVPAVSLDLLDLVLGAESLIFVDATSTGERPGRVRRLSLAEFASLATAPYCCHSLGLPDLMRLAARLAPEAGTPPVTLVGIEAAVIDRFGIALSPPVEAAVTLAVSTVLEILGEAGATGVGRGAGVATDEPPGSPPGRQQRP